MDPLVGFGLDLSDPNAVIFHVALLPRVVEVDRSVIAPPDLRTCDPKVSPLCRQVTMVESRRPSVWASVMTKTRLIGASSPARSCSRLFARCSRTNGERPSPISRKGPLTWCYLVAGAGFEPATFGL